MIAVEMGVIQTIEKIGSKGGKNNNIQKDSVIRHCTTAFDIFKEHKTRKYRATITSMIYAKRQLKF